MILLTGPSGSGKSSLAQALKRRGWQVLDGDALARSLYVPGSALMKALRRTFGGGILKADASLDTSRLGEIVFPSLKQRKRLNALVYPRFLRAVKKILRAARSRQRRLVADLAVYFDAGAPDLKLPVVLVDAPQALRVRRLLARGLTPERARAQARALRFGRAERRLSAAVLDGSRSRPQVRRQLLELLKPV